MLGNGDEAIRVLYRGIDQYFWVGKKTAMVEKEEKRKKN